MPDFPPNSSRLERLTELVDPIVAPAVYDGAGFSIPDMHPQGMYQAFTAVAPGTTPTLVVSATGPGQLLGLFAQKPSTVNSVSAVVIIAIDGVTIAAAASAGSTGARGLPCVGVLTSEGSYTGTGHNFSMPVLIPFRRSLAVYVEYSGDPGGGENITGGYLVVGT